MTAFYAMLANGGNVSHTLNFTFSANVRSNSCEASARVGQGGSSTTGCETCNYPGDPARTVSSEWARSRAASRTFSTDTHGA